MSFPYYRSYILEQNLTSILSRTESSSKSKKDEFSDNSSLVRRNVLTDITSAAKSLFQSNNDASTGKEKSLGRERISFALFIFLALTVCGAWAMILCRASREEKGERGEGV